MLVLIRGAGDIATGIAIRLWRAGVQVVMTDLPQPTAIRRTVCFSQAIVLGETQVEDATARRAEDILQARRICAAGEISVLADPELRCREELRPVFSVSKIAIPVVVGSTTIFCANRWISSGQNMSICFLRYAGNSTVRPGQEQPAFGALYFRMDFNNTPTSLALFPERPFF